jgi:hypothetical protein
MRSIHHSLDGIEINVALAPHVRAGHDPYAQVVLDFADDFHGVIELEVGVLYCERQRALKSREKQPSSRSKKE